jgi:hypothetical protein
MSKIVHLYYSESHSQCYTVVGKKTITTNDKAKVTCQNCLRKIEKDRDKAVEQLSTTMEVFKTIAYVFGIDWDEGCKKRFIEKEDFLKEL